jgi:hypothetical protein
MGGDRSIKLGHRPTPDFDGASASPEEVAVLDPERLNDAVVVTASPAMEQDPAVGADRDVQRRLVVIVGWASRLPSTTRSSCVWKPSEHEVDGFAHRPVPERRRAFALDSASDAKYRRRA